MPESDLYKPLPPYHHGQRLRCIPDAALGKSDMPPGFKYAVEIPGDRRRGQLISADSNLPLGVELEASFISHDGSGLMLTGFSGIELERSASDPDIKLMSFPVQGSLVSVTVVEKNAGGYIAEYKDFWGEGLRGTLVSEAVHQVGDCLDAAVSGWSPQEVDFVAVAEIEKEMDRMRERQVYLSGREPNSLELEMDWTGAVMRLTASMKPAEPEDMFQGMREDAEDLIARLQAEGLKLHWEDTVKALKFFAYPKEHDEVSLILKSFYEKYPEEELIDFLSYRLHPDKDCPLTPLTKEICGALSSSFSARSEA